MSQEIVTGGKNDKTEKNYQGYVHGKRKEQENTLQVNMTTPDWTVSCLLFVTDNR